MVETYAKNMPLVPQTLNFADDSSLLQKISIFLGKNSTFTQQQHESCVRGFLVLFSGLVKQKVAINEIIRTTDHASGIRLPGCSHLATYWNNHDGVIISRHNIIVNFFDVFMFLLSSLVTDPSFMSISLLVLELLQKLTRNSEIGNTLL